MQTNYDSTFFAPDYYEIEKDRLSLIIDYEAPNWIAIDKRGKRVIDNIKNGKNVRDLINSYANDEGVDLAKAWAEVDSFLNDLLRSNFISQEPLVNGAYKGRSGSIALNKLNELWIHTNNTCNLTCNHCLVDSSPSGDKGLAAEDIKETVDAAIKLGVSRFYFTGGEPFMRPDIFELIEHICGVNKKELIILTNATLLKDELIERLNKFDKALLKIQISLDGSTSEINDALRGAGSFERIVKGILNVVKAGFEPTATTAVTKNNVDDVSEVTKLLAKLGVKTHHLLWAHKRGRIAGNGDDFFVPVEKLVEVAKGAKAVAETLGITVDNFDSYKFRANGRTGARYDLGNACYDSLCVYADGDVYPSAAFAGHNGLQCGNIFENTLEEIWKNSAVAKAFRNATLQNKDDCGKCHLKFICGGGDIEHSFFYSPNGFKIKDDCFPDGAAIQAPDPYCGLHKEFIVDAVFELAMERKALFDRKTGFSAPRVLRSMGEGAVDCGLDDCATIQELKQDGKNPDAAKKGNNGVVRTLHSNCVLSFDVDKPRKAVRDFYGKAAETPQEELCCPVKNDDADTSHIPKETLDRFYGCGSPITIAGVKEGETLVDLGSGAGIDCFIAAKRVGANGKIYGIDMTDEMLKVANESKKTVATNLGYDVVEFRKGFLEQIPVDDNCVDLITSNCVINLSPDKKAVFGEMWRILKDHGRIVISDIVSAKETPDYMRANKQLWGECISGSLTENDFVSFLEQVGFYGVQTLNKVFWKEVEGYSFYSVTVKGYKFEKTDGCVFAGQKAVYNGPYKAAIDDEGHMFPRNREIEICEDTAAKLSKPPYAGQFTIIGGQNDGAASAGCCSDESGSACC